MPNELKIFISHKMPSDTVRANEIGSLLALFGGNQVKVNHAGKFRKGVDWMDEIKKELNDANWLIHLHTAPDEDWQFCMLECGYFLGRQTTKTQDRLLITFCKHQDQISPALKGFNAVPISEHEIMKLLTQIYHDPPWEIKPDLSPTKIADTAKSIVSAFGDDDVINYDIAPGIIF